MGHRVRVMGHGLRLLCFGTVGALLTLWVVAQTHAQARQAPTVSGDRFAGLEWTFVRVRYGSWAENLVQFRRTYWSDPWAIDGPAAEQNLSRRLQTVTAIQVNDPIVLPLDDEQLWEYPWLYFAEPGNLRFTEAEIPIMREFLLRGLASSPPVDPLTLRSPEEEDRDGTGGESRDVCPEGDAADVLSRTHRPDAAQKL